MLVTIINGSKVCSIEKYRIYNFVLVRLTIPPGEVKNKKELAFKDMMISQFQQNIPNFGDRDVSEKVSVNIFTDKRSP